jgi:hypothetical protein
LIYLISSYLVVFVMKFEGESGETKRA